METSGTTSMIRLIFKGRDPPFFWVVSAESVVDRC